MGSNSGHSGIHFAILQADGTKCRVPKYKYDKGGIIMTGFANAIVWMWFLPVVLFIVLPLTMLCCWLVWRVVAQRKARLTAAVREVKVVKSEMLAKAGA
jgi:hypothetical protein